MHTTTDTVVLLHGYTYLELLQDASRTQGTILVVVFSVIVVIVIAVFAVFALLTVTGLGRREGECLRLCLCGGGWRGEREVREWCSEYECTQLFGHEERLEERVLIARVAEIHEPTETRMCALMIVVHTLRIPLTYTQGQTQAGRHKTHTR